MRRPICAVVTGFFFNPDGTVYVSTYGRGLWAIDTGRRAHQFPFELYCEGDCLTRFVLVPEPPEPKDVSGVPWKQYNVLVVMNGRINGVIRSGELIVELSA